MPKALQAAVASLVGRPDANREGMTGRVRASMHAMAASETFTIRVDPGLAKQIRTLAKREGQSVNGWVVSLFVRELLRQERAARRS